MLKLLVDKDVLYAQVPASSYPVTSCKHQPALYIYIYIYTYKMWIYRYTDMHQKYPGNRFTIDAMHIMEVRYGTPSSQDDEMPNGCRTSPKDNRDIIMLIIPN